MFRVSDCLSVIKFKNTKFFLTKIDPPQLNCRERYEVKEKTDWQPCLADGLPKPDISLYKNGKNIQLPFYPKWSDSGLYHLTASNKHGNVNSYFTLNILCKKKNNILEYCIYFLQQPLPLK